MNLTLIIKFLNPEVLPKSFNSPHLYQNLTVAKCIHLMPPDHPGRLIGIRQ